MYVCHIVFNFLCILNFWSIQPMDTQTFDDFRNTVWYTFNWLTFSIHLKSDIVIIYYKLQVMIGRFYPPPPFMKWLWRLEIFLRRDLTFSHRVHWKKTYTCIISIFHKYLISQANICTCLIASECRGSCML